MTRAQARNAADAGTGCGTLAIPALGKRKDKGSKGGKGAGKAEGPALAIIAPGDPYLNQNFVPAQASGINEDDPFWGMEADDDEHAASADFEAIEEGLERNKKARLDEADPAATPIG